MAAEIEPEPAPAQIKGAAGAVFIAFLKLGLTAYGGPVAHLGYFREVFVNRRHWLDEAAYAELVALCQFLPGPASSQVGFAIGLRRAGLVGALAAWTAFTLPSAVLMTALAFSAGIMSGPWAQSVIHGLKLVAVAVVAQAVWGMARTLTPDVSRIAIGAGAFVLVTFVAGALGQIGAIGLGACAGLVVCRAVPKVSSTALLAAGLSRRFGLGALAVLLLLLAGLPALAALTHNTAITQFGAFYRSGALVFGGGHVVLPLLKQAVVDSGWVSQDTFLAGYGAAQAMPGPLFTFAAFLGATMNGLAGAVFGLLGIFLPGMLALLAVLPFWSRLQAWPPAGAAMRGANAAVVGILAAALYSPVWTTSVHDPVDIAIAAAGFILLTSLGAPPVLVVALGAAAGPIRLMV